MIITRHEAASTKAALQDIAQTHGDSVFIISNTRLEGRNVVYFASNGLGAAGIEEQALPVIAPFVAEPSPATTGESADAAPTRKRPAARQRPARKKTDIAQPTALDRSITQPQFDALEREVVALRRLLEEGMQSSTAALARQAEIVDQAESMAKRQKSTVDQLNRRLGRQTELMTRLLEKQSTNVSSGISPLPPRVERGSLSAESMDEAAQLYRYMVRNNDIANPSSWATGIHIVLTDAITDSNEACASFAIAMRSLIPDWPTVFQKYKPDGKSTGTQENCMRVVEEQYALRLTMEHHNPTEGLVIFMTLRDYLNVNRTTLDSVHATLHGFFSNNSFEDNLELMIQAHGLRLASLSVADVRPLGNVFQQLFALTRYGVPLLLVSTRHTGLARIDENTFKAFSASRSPVLMILRNAIQYMSTTALELSRLIAAGKWSRSNV